jgi:arylformamidase
MKKIYDISLLLGKECPNRGGAEFVTEFFEMKIGDSIFIGTKLSINAHTGTHLDAPSHLHPYKKELIDYPLERFILPAVVAEINDPEKISTEELKLLDINAGDAVLFKTANSQSGKATDPCYQARDDLGITPGSYVYLDMGAATYLVEKGVCMLGLDFGMGEKPEYPLATELHHYIFQNDVIFLESINLKGISVGRYTLVALPLKMERGTGIPVRAVLIED